MKKLVYIFIFFVFVIVGVYVCYLAVDAKKEVPRVESLLTKQNDVSSKINSYGYTFDNPLVILDPYDISPLSALIVFETDSYESVTVSVMGKSSSVTYTHTYSASNKHYLSVYGMYPDYDNHIIVSYNDKVHDVYIKTGSLPYELSDVDTSVRPDGSLLRFVTMDGVYPYAYDENGDIRWYLSSSMKGNVSYLYNNHIILSNDRFVSFADSRMGFVEMDMMGKIYYEYISDYSYYYNYCELPNYNILALSVLSSLDGVGKYLVEFDHQNGEVVSKVDLSSYLDYDDSYLDVLIFYDDLYDRVVVIYDNDKVLFIDRGTNSVTLLSSITDMSDGSIVNVSKVSYYGDGVILVDGEFKEEKEGGRYYKFSSDKIILGGDSYVSKYDVNEFRYSDYVSNQMGILFKNTSVSKTSSLNLFIFKYYKADLLYDNYDVSFVYEEGRLAVYGDFASSDRVKIILDRFLGKKIYDVDVSSSRGVTYINDTLLKGRYSIYVMINDKIYKSDYYVVF